MQEIFYAFTVPSTDAYGYPFSNWNAGETSTTYSFTPSSAGSITIYRRVADSAASHYIVQSIVSSVRVNSALVALLFLPRRIG